MYRDSKVRFGPRVDMRTCSYMMLLRTSTAFMKLYMTLRPLVLLGTAQSISSAIRFRSVNAHRIECGVGTSSISSRTISRYKGVNTARDFRVTGYSSPIGLWKSSAWACGPPMGMKKTAFLIDSKELTKCFSRELPTSRKFHFVGEAKAPVVS